MWRYSTIIACLPVLATAGCIDGAPELSGELDESITSSSPEHTTAPADQPDSDVTSLPEQSDDALASTAPRPLRKRLSPMQLSPDGSVTVDGHTYPDLAAFQRSDKFREEGRRCGTVMPAQQDLFLSRNDCTASKTTIQAEYEPGPVYEVQVVFHIVRSTSGQGNISDDRVRSQLEILNEDYLARAGTPGAPGNFGGIRFVLARVAPDGSPTTGIVRYTNNEWFNDCPGNDGCMQRALRWDPSRYLNIYSASLGDILGYATLPQYAAGAAEDGVVLGYQFIGRNSPGGVYNQGRTATHEVGHYLGLLHTFDGGCGNLSAPYTSGDRIADTTPESSPKYDCVESRSSCCNPSNQFGGCPDVESQNNPIHNYMDYTNDTCMDHFTIEQINRMRCSLLNYRPRLFNEVPTAEFTHTTPDGMAINFADASRDGDGTIMSWRWDFGDGTTSTERNPSHTYATSGTYNVSLTVTDDRGSEGTVTRSFLANFYPLVGFDYQLDGTCVTFSDRSSDPNGMVETWSWDFGDGASSGERNPVHVYEQAGTYTVKLSVTDNDGSTAVAELPITVEESGCNAGGGRVPYGAGLLLGLTLLALGRVRRARR